MSGPSDFQTAFVARSVQNVKTELEFLHSTGVISATTLHAIVVQLPQASDLSASNSILTQSVRAPSTVAPPHQAQSPAAVPTTFSAPSGPPPGYSPDGPGQHQSPVQLPANGAPYPSEKQPINEPRIGTAVALFAYESNDTEDLNLKRDDRIAVIRHENADWSYGINERTNGRGIFPRGYVRMEETGHQQQQMQPYNHGSYGNMPMQVASDPSSHQVGAPAEGGANGGKGAEMGKKFGKKLGNAAIFGAGATIGSNIVNSIF